MKKKTVTREMVLERVHLLINTLESDFEHSVKQGNSHKKRMELAYLLLRKLSENKVPPAVILAQFNKHFGDLKIKRKVPLLLTKELKMKISNPINLN